MADIPVRAQVGHRFSDRNFPKAAVRVVLDFDTVEERQTPSRAPPTLLINPQQVRPKRSSPAISKNNSESCFGLERNGEWLASSLWTAVFVPMAASRAAIINSCPVRGIAQP
jgi:hypothetical protein